MSKNETLHTAITKISREYSQASRETFKDHPLAHFIRQEFNQVINLAAKRFSKNFITKSSPGNGNWATVPWGAVFNPSITQSATEGFFVVYLFSDYTNTIHLSLNQGTTEILNEFGSRGYSTLAARAEIQRERLRDYQDKLPVAQIDFKNKSRLPLGYSKGHILGIDYYLHTLPDNEKLISDLHLVLDAYTSLDFRGGVDVNSHTADEDDREILQKYKTIEEIRKYKMHRKLDRRAGVSKAVKKQLGTTCMACEMNFLDIYGDIGKDFIEAHHKVPISSLEEGATRQYDIGSDFAVLCSNCHRMIHRFDDVSDIEGLRALILKHRKQ